MTHEQEARELPWYHGVRLVADDFCTLGGHKTRIGSPPRHGNMQTSRTIAFIQVGYDKSAPKDPYNLSFKRAEEFAALFAAAPETAAERDALKQQVSTLTAQRDKAVEALRPIKALAEFFDGWKEPLPDDAAINRQLTLGQLRNAAAVVKEIENALSPN